MILLEMDYDDTFLEFSEKISKLSLRYEMNEITKTEFINELEHLEKDLAVRVKLIGIVGRELFKWQGIGLAIRNIINELNNFFP